MKSKETTDLYSQKDVNKVREQLYKEQNRKCLCTDLEIPEDACVLDHSHDDQQYVRGVLHRQVNAAIGKIENLYVRMLSFWYPYDLPTFLKQVAEYLSKKEPDTRYRHPGWLKKVSTKFCKLNAQQQLQILQQLTEGNPGTKNISQRKALFIKLIRQRKLPAAKIYELLEKASGTGERS
jgi:hypothetical protein